MDEVLRRITGFVILSERKILAVGLELPEGIGKMFVDKGSFFRPECPVNHIYNKIDSSKAQNAEKNTAETGKQVSNLQEQERSYRTVNRKTKQPHQIRLGFELRDGENIEDYVLQ